MKKLLSTFLLAGALFCSSFMHAQSAKLDSLLQSSGDCTPYIDEQIDSAYVLILQHDFQTAADILHRAETIANSTNTPLNTESIAMLYAMSMLANYRTDNFSKGWEQESKFLESPKRSQVTYGWRYGDMYYKYKDLIVLDNSTVENLRTQGDIVYSYNNSTINNATYDNVDYYSDANQSDSLDYQHIDAQVKIDSMTISRDQQNATAARTDRPYLRDLCQITERLINVGNYEDAERICSHAIDIIANFYDYLPESYGAQATYYMAVISAYNGAWKDAIEYLEYAYPYYAENDDYEMLAQLLVIESKYHTHFFNHSEALRYADYARDAYNYFPREQWNADKAFNVFMNYINCLMDIGEYEQAIEWLASLQHYIDDEQGEQHPNRAKTWLTYLDYGLRAHDDEACRTGFIRAREILGANEQELLYESGLSELFAKDYIDLYSMGAQYFLNIHDDNNAKNASEMAVRYVIKYYGDEHPYALTPVLLYSQGLQRVEGKMDYAVRNTNFANRLAKKLYGDNHWMVGETQWRLAEIALALNDIREFEQHVDTIVGIFTHNIRHEFTFLTSAQRAQYWQRQSGILDKICAHAIQIHSPQICRSAYDASLITKGMLLKTDIEIANIVAQSNDTTLEQQYFQLIELNDRKRLAQEHGTEFPAELEDEKEDLEQQIQRRVLEYGDFTTALNIRWQDVRNNLKNNEVAIEFLAIPQGENATTYCALLLRHTSKSPELIPMFEEMEAKVLIDSNPGITYNYNENGKDLSYIVWQHVLSHIKQGETIYFAPSGLLHQLAIEALPYDAQHTMADMYNMVRVSSTREIAISKDAIQHTTATLYGGILYDVNPDTLQAESRQYAKRLVGIRSLTTDTIKRDEADYLPATLTEVETISAMLNKENITAHVFTATRANEESFKVLSGTHQNILHIATHGFFWTNTDAQESDYFSQRMLSVGDDMPAPPAIDPLSRCGLLFSGANTALQGHSKELPEDVQDGILTAKEISLLDLRDADIVVLSACETGNGEITGDGVFGLQRAFKQAGAQTIVMSLWSVSDAATQLLMTEFYHNWITLHQPKREAFRNAQNTVRAKYEEPDYWAGFVMLD